MTKCRRERCCLACITGALWAKQAKHAILHKAQDEVGRKILEHLLPVPCSGSSPHLMYAHKYWLTAVMSKGPIKPQSNTRKSHLSGYHQHQQQHKPREMKITRAWITFTNVRLSAAKVRFAQSKLSWCPNTVAGKKHVVQTNSKVTFHIIRSLWVVFGLSTLNSKKLVNQAFSKPSWKYNVNPRTS